MKYCILLLTVLLLPFYSFSQASTKLKKTKYPSSFEIKETFYVVKKSNLKHGDYKLFFENGNLKEKGLYVMGEKSGIWETFDNKGQKIIISEYQNDKKLSEKKIGIWKKYFENGQVITGFDYDKNEKIKTIINVPVQYPRIAMEKGTEGIVKIKVKLDENCEIIEFNVVENVSKECDNEAIRCHKKLIELMKKYAPEECSDYDKILPLEFKLEG